MKNYKYIINPVSKTKYKFKSKKGIKLLKLFLKKLKGGSKTTEIKNLNKQITEKNLIDIIKKMKDSGTKKKTFKIKK